MGQGATSNPSTQETPGAAATPPTGAAPAAPPPAAAPAAVTPPAPTAAAAPPAPVPAAAPTTPSAPEPKPVANQPTHRLLRDDEDDIPTDAELLAMSSKSLKGRLERHTKKQLRERFGTDDPEIIKGKLERLEQFEQQEEQRRLESLSEMDRLKEQLQKEQAARTAAEQQVFQMQETQVVQAADRRINRVAEKFIDPEYMELELPKLAKHIQGASEEELRDPDKFLTEYFQERIKQKPQVARGYAQQTTTENASTDASVQTQQQQTAPEGTTTTPAAPQPQVVRVPFSNGGNGERPDNAFGTGQLTTKTAALGRPNSMSDAEWKAYKRQNGINY